MPSKPSPSLEELVRRHNIVLAPVAALQLDSGMVMKFKGRLRIVISVAYENAESGPMVVVESVDGLHKFASDAQLDVWHADGKPFIVDSPPDFGKTVAAARGGVSVPPAHDAAGIVPPWRGPKRHK